MSKNSPGKLLVISGLSAGVGKDTILNLFCTANPDWYHPISTTTRPIRGGEKNGREMRFVDVSTFDNWRREGKFLEAFLVVGNWYGTLREPVEDLIGKGKNVVLRKDVQGALAIKAAIPSSIIIMILPESWDALEARLRARGTENEHTIAERLAVAKEEMKYKNQFDHIIVNPTGHPEHALKELQKLIWHS